MKPHPLQETKNSDTIKLLFRNQKHYLLSVAKSLNDDPDFHKLLLLLENLEVEDNVREEAEKAVMKACLEYGEWWSSGDQLTVKMMTEAMMIMAGSLTAYERLEFLGPVRLGMMHMKMKKITQDYALCMKNEINMDDVLSLPWCVDLNRMKISNEEKKIKKNDSSFEAHDQYIATVQRSYFLNMFDNYVKTYPDKLAGVSNTQETICFMREMFQDYDIALFYDPSKQDDKTSGFDDLHTYCKVCTKMAKKSRTNTF